MLRRIEGQQLGCGTSTVKSSCCMFKYSSFGCVTLRHLPALGKEICPEMPWTEARCSRPLGRAPEGAGPIVFGLCDGRWSLPGGRGGRGNGFGAGTISVYHDDFLLFVTHNRHPISIYNKVYYCLQAPATRRAPAGSLFSFLLSEAQACIFFSKLFFLPLPKA